MSVVRSTLTVVEGTSAPNVDLTTLEAVKAELGITTDTEDATLSARITRASNIIAEACNRVFALQDVVQTFYLDCWRNQPLVLSRYPVAEIASIDENEVELDDEIYQVDHASGILYRLDALAIAPYWSCWPVTGTVVVAYAGGYNLPDDAPALLEQACIELVRDYRSSSQAAERDTTIRSITRDGVGSVTYAAGSSSSSSGALPLSVASLIERYRSHALA